MDILEIYEDNITEVNETKPAVEIAVEEASNIGLKQEKKPCVEADLVNSDGDGKESKTSFAEEKLRDVSVRCSLTRCIRAAGVTAYVPRRVRLKGEVATTEGIGAEDQIFPPELAHGLSPTIKDIIGYDEDEEARLRRSEAAKLSKSFPHFYPEEGCTKKDKFSSLIFPGVEGLYKEMLINEILKDDAMYHGQKWTGAKKTVKRMPSKRLPTYAVKGNDSFSCETKESEIKGRSPRKNEHLEKAENTDCPKKAFTFSLGSLKSETEVMSSEGYGSPPASFKMQNPKVKRVDKASSTDDFEELPSYKAMSPAPKNLKSKSSRAKINRNVEGIQGNDLLREPSSDIEGQSDCSGFRTREKLHRKAVKRDSSFPNPHIEETPPSKQTYHQDANQPDDGANDEDFAEHVDLFLAFISNTR